MQNTITALTTQKRNPNRVNIFLDGEFSFGLYIINAGHLKVGQTISQEMIDSLKKNDQIEEGFQKALKYISFKPRTTFEVVKKLKENDFEEDIISLVLEMLVEKGYVNDLEYAKNWVENRSVYKPRSKKLITWELKNKKISEDIISEVTGEMISEEELAILAAEKYARRLSGYEKEVFFQRLSGYLIRRGFSYSTVNSTVQTIWNIHRQQTYENSNGK
ncbi:MAG: RecX family transcriptional regulator [Anaerolineaceae bacterium]|nr:RecX family transcriptional regulator [Anaerolineaceae bacterium]